MTSLNRLPTKLETASGAVVALFLSGALGWVLWYAGSAVAEHRLTLGSFVLAAFIALAMIFAWSSSLFLRIVFGKPQKPSFRAQGTIGWLMVLGGGLLAIIPLLPWFHGADLKASLRGLAALIIGFAWVYQSRKDART
jgi:hypothetical protein